MSKTSSVKRGVTQFSTAKVVAHELACYNPTVQQFSTSAQTNINKSGCGVGIQENLMFWESSENVVTTISAWELGLASQAVAAINKSLSLNPMHGCYREEILTGALLPVLEQGGAAGCYVWANGKWNDKNDTLQTGTYLGKPYTINNNPCASLSKVPTNDLGANGALACQMMNDYIRGGGNHLNWIDTVSKQWNGIGFTSAMTGTMYQTRAVGLMGCAMLVADYDPLGIFPQMDELMFQLQGPNGSFPNEYDAPDGEVKPGQGDAESYNRTILWNCPTWLKEFQELEATETQETPYIQVFQPPKYIPLTVA